MSNETPTNQPAATLRDGGIKATIWRNASKNGDFFSVQFARTYMDDGGQYHDTDSFRNGEVLRLARLAQQAYDVIADLRQQDTA